MLIIRHDQPEEDAVPLAALITEFTGMTTSSDQMKARLQRSQAIEHPLFAEWDGKVVGFASPRLLHYSGEDIPYAELSELLVTGLTGGEALHGPSSLRPNPSRALRERRA